MFATIEERLNETREHFLERLCLEFKSDKDFFVKCFDITKDDSFGWNIELKPQWRK